ncbi:MAG TPA: hypothetical protein VG407_10815 [Caulobacteraceae bacterium]|jgi:hypothetical protein|nr:hypothetical protein [Caulobacteraceae bacterium]
MTSYRLYGCNGAGKIVFGDFIECADEAAAREAARPYLNRYAVVEVWVGKRQLFKLEADRTKS